MRSSLLVFLVYICAGEAHEYQYDKPDQLDHQIETVKGTQFGTKLIKGNNEKYYEVSILPSREMYETHLPSQQQVRTTTNQTHPPVINSTPNFEFNRNSQQSLNNQQQQFNLKSNLFNSVAAVDNVQNHYNQLQQQQRTQHPQQAGLFSETAPQQQHQTRSFIQNAPQQFGTFSQQQQADFPFQILQQQQQFYPQQHKYYPQKPLCNNYLPNSINLQNNLVNIHKYVSQSEASQLGVPHKHINANPRQFLRIITKCDVSGQCEPLNVGNDGNGISDFQHQQVLKQSQAQLQPHDNMCRNKFNYQFTSNALTGNAAKELRGIPINKGTDLRDRRLFPYCEVLISQYPHN